ncbi:MAG: IS21 family transposase [Rhodopseudomonas palustris]|nr:IS21 family transposase [Rhodopseudomonas palustris]
MKKLSTEEVHTVLVLSQKREKNTEIAKRMGVTEGTIRYHIRRKEQGAGDGRSSKPMLAESHEEMIRQYMEDHVRERDRNLRVLYEEMAETGYLGSYRSVVRYVGRHFPKAKERPYRRVETGPGIQAQTDWIERMAYLESESGYVKVYGLVIKLSHSRGQAAVWRRACDMANWIEGHNQAWMRIGGIPAVERLDNLKTAAMRGAGPTAELHPVYRSYSRELGYAVDFCRARSPRDKGKVERQNRFINHLMDFPHRQFRDLEDLQRMTDRNLEKAMNRLICPVTGKSVRESLQIERKVLKPLPEMMPEVFDNAVQRRVSRDCLVSFEGRKYSVPYACWGDVVEVRGTMSGRVHILHGGQLVGDHPRATESRLILDPDHYERDPRVEGPFPTPLGKMARKMRELSVSEVERRPVDYYEALVEVRS